MSFPEGYEIHSNNFKIDRYTIVGNIQEILKIELEPITDVVELVPLSEMNFYDDYVNEYNQLYKKFPHLRSEVKTESLESLNDSAIDGLLYKIEVNGTCAGVIAGYVEDYFGRNEVCILEELLFEAYRSKGLAVYIQKVFAKKMLNRFEILWGHISVLNIPSLKTALKN